MYEKINELRLLVGFLGEKSQANWWPSQFLSANSAPFLEPIFPRTWHLAQLTGMNEAARRVHDERIGMGRVFHLFRLPESYEERLFEVANAPGWLSDKIDLVRTADDALEALSLFCGQGSKESEGPVLVAEIKDLLNDTWLADLAAAYYGAFSSGRRCFPYIAAT